VRPPGDLYVPAGDGPFPAVVWSHGSEREPDDRSGLGSFWNSAGYVLFAPHRSGHGDAPGEYPIDALRRQAGGDPRTLAPLLIELHERQLGDTLAAIDWLAEQPFVDHERVVASGVSHGGIQTLLATASSSRVCAGIPFAPAAMAWRSLPELHGWLAGAVRRARAPLFLIQAENDFDLGPARALGPELRPPSRVRVYPPYGPTSEHGHAGFACDGTDVWGAEVLAFLDEVLAPSRDGAARRAGA
jgi:carboxymethylenebutenolidase